jgi:hypothetical protein
MFMGLIIVSRIKTPDVGILVLHIEAKAAEHNSLAKY